MQRRSRRAARRAALVLLAVTGLVVGGAVPSGLLAERFSTAAAAASPAPVVGSEVGLEGGRVVGSVGDRAVGTWQVDRAGVDTWRVRWTSPERLPVTGDRPTVVTAAEDQRPGARALDGPPARTPVGVPTVGDDGRTVEVTVVSAEPPAPELLDVVLSGRQLDEPAPPPVAGRSARWSEPDRELLDVDPGVPGDLPVVSSDYALDGLRLPGMPAEAEMVGHVVKPAPEAASIEHPLVLFLHGRHGYCYHPEKALLTWRWPCRGAQKPVPSHLGYGYLQRLLASQGYVTVSVAANGINAQDGDLADGGADARSRLVRAHLDQWAKWAGHRHQVDLRRVVLVGHSRGGEGVARAALELPLDAPYRIAGQVLLAPTAFSRQSVPYVPTVTVLPYCDGDVADLQGQSYVDGSRDVALDDTSLKSSVLMVGANHNFFNTEWTPGHSAAPSNDDWWSRSGACGKGSPTRLSAGGQRRVAAAYVAGAVHLFGGDAEELRAMYDGSAVRVSSARDAVVLSHSLGGGRDLRRPGVDATLAAPAGTRTQLCHGVTSSAAGDQCGRYADSPMDTPHWPSEEPQTPTYRAFEMSWEAAGGRGGLRFAAPVDLRASTALELRTVVDNRRGDVSLRVRLTDAAGSSTMAPGTFTLPALPRGPFPGKYWAQNLRVEVAGLTGVDISRIREVDLVGASDDGRVWVLDVAAAVPHPPAVPVKRVPLVDLGEVRVDEGNASTAVARVPFTLSSPASSPGRFRVYGHASLLGERRELDVEVPAGATGGVLEWRYSGNTSDSLRRTVHSLTAYGITELTTRDYHGRVVVVDDDPAPSVRLRRVRGRVGEGGTAAWRVTLSEPVDYDLGVEVTPRRPRGAVPVRLDDLRRRWVDRWVWSTGRGNPPLHRTELGLYKRLAAGRTAARVTVPVRQDHRVERREAITLTARVAQLRWRSRPVTVSVRRGR